VLWAGQEGIEKFSSNVFHGVRNRGYGRIALILDKLHLGLKKVMVELLLGSKKVFQQKYHTFTDIYLLSGWLVSLVWRQ